MNMAKTFVPAERVEELEAEVARLREQLRWIPVTERVPFDGCLVETLGPYMAPGHCWYRGGRWVNAWDTTLDMSGVVYWRYIIDRDGPQEDGEK